MFRRSADAGKTQSGLSLNSWERPLPLKIVGLAFLVGAALLLLGGAFREQANMISSGLLFLSFGVLFAADIVRRSRIILISICALAVLGVLYALTT